MFRKDPSTRLSLSLPMRCLSLVLLIGSALHGVNALSASPRSIQDSAADTPLTRQKKTDFPRLGQEIVRTVKSHFYDAKRAEAWAAACHDYAANITGKEPFARKTHSVLAALHSSHTGYYLPDDPEYSGLLSIFESMLRPEGVWYDSIGVDVVRKRKGYFVRVVFAGSPAARAGLRRGDLLLAANNLPFQPVNSFENKSGQVIELRVQRHKAELPFPVQVTPRRIKPREEWLTAQKEGTRIFRRGGRRIAYIPFFSGAGEEYQEAAQEAIAGPLQQADALILDFRNGYGGFNPDFVTLFDRSVPVLTMRDRSGKKTVVDRQWRKPLYILINGEARSGKEVVAFALQKHHLARLVGEKTAGAVLGGRPFLLSDNSLLYLAVSDGMVDGQRLEGKGVAPDVFVPDALSFAAGEDKQLEKALTLAAGTR